MDAAAVFRQGLGSVAPRPYQPPLQQQHQQQYLQQQQHQQQSRKPPPSRSDDPSETDDASHRIAHTLTACCRCRQRKTRCDPTLPRCLPCERSGSTCEYFDTTKGKKISRFYVIKLQDKVRALEAELAQYTDDDNEFPRSNEDMVRPGGLVMLNETDETPRYLGPSSGIAMTRLLMEEAKLFTDSKRISELIPEVRARRQARMQSVVMTGTAAAAAAAAAAGGPASRKKSYPMVSAHPAQSLPTRQVADKLVDLFNQRAQIFWPTLHEKQFAKDLDAVYNGDTDPYKNFVVRMVLAISLQKFDPQYAGLGDSYYLASMQYFEDVVRPKDLKTLQCLVLLGQYSLLTPTRTAVYYVIGLATRIVQQEGLADEKTIANGYSLGLVDALTVDMRRRLAWIVASMEYGLSHSMGRPVGFAKGNDRLDVGFFAAVDDEHITEEGIRQDAPVSQKKTSAIHFFKMRMLQAEIRKTLYEKKRSEPRDENHQWFKSIDHKIQEWLDTSPKDPAWAKPWFTGRYHQMKIFVYRPSPQIPKPSSRAAITCFDGAQYIIDLSKQQMETGAVDVSWVYLLNLYMAINILLWAVSYPEVRQAHAREEVEELVNITLDIIDQCTERWPGASAASSLYSIFSKACLQSYETKDTPTMPASSTFGSPPSLIDANSPSNSDHSAATSAGAQQQQMPGQQQQQPQVFPVDPPQFGYVFDSAPDSNINPFSAYEGSFPPQPRPSQPAFRSNSIFYNPSTDGSGRRFSYFPPDFKQEDSSVDEATPPATTTPGHVSSPLPGSLPTPPESLLTPNMTSRTLSPPSLGPTPVMSHASPVPLQSLPVPAPLNTTNLSPVPPKSLLQPQPPQRGPTFVVPPATPQGLPQNMPQRPLPGTTNSGIVDWFSPPPPFMSPYAFSSMSNNFFNESTAGLTGFGGGGGGGGGGAGLGLTQMGPGGPTNGQLSFPYDRHGSLSQQQQLELMDVLENEGMSDIDAYLNMGSAGLASGGSAEGAARW